MLFFLVTLTSQADNWVPVKQYPRGHLGVDVTVNGNLTFPFIIDTGAQGAIFPTALVNALGKDIDKLNTIEIQGAVGSKNVKQMSVDTMAIGQQRVNNVDGVVLDLPAKHLGKKSPGVLPYTFLNQFIPHFDLANNRLSLGAKTNGIAESYLKNYTKIPFKLIQGSFISFDLTVNGQTIAATLDSGAGNRIDMNWAAAKMVGIEEDNNNLPEGDPIKGAGGKSLSTKRLDGTKLKIEGIDFEKDSVNVANMPVMNLLHGNKPSANVGIGIFAKRQLIIDYDNKVMLVSSAAAG